MLRCLRNRARLRSVMSAFVGKADMMRTCFDVRFWPKADIARDCLVPSRRVSFRSNPHGGEAVVNTYP